MISRRNFLKRAGMLAGGAAAIAVVGLPETSGRTYTVIDQGVLYIDGAFVGQRVADRTVVLRDGAVVIDSLFERCNVTVERGADTRILGSVFTGSTSGAVLKVAA